MRELLLQEGLKKKTRQWLTLTYALYRKYAYIAQSPFHWCPIEARALLKPLTHAKTSRKTLGKQSNIQHYGRQAPEETPR